MDLTLDQLRVLDAVAKTGSFAAAAAALHRVPSWKDVYRVQPDGTMSMVLEDSGRDIVGAGVSTCAPTE